MPFFLTDEQEKILDEFLNSENETITIEQLKSSAIPDDIRELLQKALETGNPIPFHDTRYGYYSVSFTPCDFGVRIYAHHHITDKSFKIYDPAVDVIDSNIKQLQNAE